MINIAIDGHVGSGKSTLAKGIAKALGLHVLDTGAIYRGLTCAFGAANYDEINEKNILDFVKKVNLKIEFEGDEQHVIVNDVDYTPYLRLEKISLLTASLAQYQTLRDKVVEFQREFAKRYDCIIEGRDIGTIVLPKATVKFFVTASEEVRANRRFLQMKDKPNSPSFDEILADLRERDYKDEHRSVAPLKPAPDSIILDNSNMTLEETIKYCTKIIKDKIK